jgi:hypothetical protein
MRLAVETLIDLGVLKHEDVKIIEGDEIYDYVKVE